MLCGGKISRRPLRRGREGFVVGSLRVAGRQRAVLSVGPRQEAGGPRGGRDLLICVATASSKAKKASPLIAKRSAEQIYINNKSTCTGMCTRIISSTSFGLRTMYGALRSPWPRQEDLETETEVRSA